MKNSCEHANDPSDFNIQACSVTDCTGLIPTLPESEDEVDAYRELYPFIPEMDEPETLK